MMGYSQANVDKEIAEKEQRQRQQDERTKSQKYKIELRNMIETKKFDEL